MGIRLWILNHYAGGSGTRHYDMARELVRRGHEVTVCASSFDHQTRVEKKAYAGRTQLEETREGVRFVWIRTPAYRRNDWRRVLNMAGYAWRAYRALAQRTDRPDVVVGSLMHPFAALAGYFLARRHRCRFYFEERDLWPQTLIDLGRLKPGHPAVWLLSRLELFLYRKADRIIVLFSRAVDYVQQRGIDRSKVLLIPNGVDLAAYDRGKDALPPDFEALFESLRGKTIAAYTGAHGLANHLDTVLEAAGRLKELGEARIHLLLVGDGPEKDRLVRTAVNRGLDNVTFLPPVAKSSIPAILRRVHVGLLPLKDSPVFRWGISPNKLYDYMAAALPVILLCDTDDSDVERSGGGKVVRGDFAANLALELRGYADDETRRRAEGERGRAYVAEHRNWSTLSLGLVKEFQ